MTQGIDRYLGLDLRNGQSWCVMPEDRDDIIRAVRKFAEASPSEEFDCGHGTDELLELTTIGGARIWLLASAIFLVHDSTIETRAQSRLVDDSIEPDIDAKVAEIKRVQAQVDAVTR